MIDLRRHLASQADFAITMMRSRSVLILLLVSLVPRLLLALYYGNWVPSSQDDNSYSQLAWRLATGYGYSFSEPWYPGFAPADTPTAHWSFLYTGILAVIYSLVGYQPVVVRLFGSITGGILLPLMVFRLARRILPNRRDVALLSAFLAAAYGYFIIFAVRLMTETLFIAAVLWSLERSIVLEQELSGRRGSGRTVALGLGVSLGLATLLRQAILPWIVVLFIWLFIVGLRNGTLKIAIARMAVSGFVIILFVIPFTIRNLKVYDDFLLLNSNAGYAMYSAQHPLHGVDFQEFTAAPLPANPIPVPQNEAQWDRYLLREGIGFVVRDPGRYLLLSLSRVLDYIKFWPSAETSTINNIGRVGSFAVLLPFIPIGLWQTRQGWQKFRLLYAFILAYSLMHIFTWAMIRYRLPVDGVLIIFGAVGMITVVQRLKIAEKIPTSLTGLYSTRSTD